MQPVLPAFKKQLTITIEQLDAESQELRELEFKLESMSVSIREPPPVGNSRQICSHCHRRGHRNNSSNPCKLPKCNEYTYCGNKEKHPEYQNQINCLKSDIKKKKQLVDKLEQQVKSMQDFTAHNEYHFIKNLTPRLQAADTRYKLNRVKLLRDIRMLRKFLDGQIPEVTSNDAEQLKALVAKCRRNMRQDCRDFPDDVVDAQIETTNSPHTGINLNVSISPVHNSNSRPDSIHHSETDKKVKQRHDQRKKKRSSRSSSSDSESEDTRHKPRKSRRKIPFEQQDVTVLPPPYNPYLGQLGARQYLPYMHESTPGNFMNMCYPFQTPFPQSQTQRIFTLNRQFAHLPGHQNIHDISSPQVGYTSMPMAQAFNHNQSNSLLYTDGPHTYEEGQQQESNALDILVDAATSSNR